MTQLTKAKLLSNLLNVMVLMGVLALSACGGESSTESVPSSSNEGALELPEQDIGGDIDGEATEFSIEIDWQS